jgi:hypothetical protein
MCSYSNKYDMNPNTPACSTLHYKNLISDNEIISGLKKKKKEFHSLLNSVLYVFKILISKLAVPNIVIYRLYLVILISHAVT